MLKRAGGKVGGQALDIIAAAPGVDDPALAALGLQEKLGVSGDAGREIRRQRKGFVE
ncbi:hypothetical protein D3C83_252100 [compost metagenome]